jgi:hypothetical protein
VKFQPVGVNLPEPHPLLLFGIPVGDSDFYADVLSDEVLEFRQVRLSAVVPLLD